MALFSLRRGGIALAVMAIVLLGTGPQAGAAPQQGHGMRGTLPAQPGGAASAGQLGRDGGVRAQGGQRHDGAHRHGHHHHHGFHGPRFGGWWVNGGWWGVPRAVYPAPVYPAYAYPNPVVVTQDQRLRYYCPALQAFYPEALSCPGEWLLVLPVDPAPPY